MDSPLEGIKIVECGIWQMGPSASALLGDLGAEVIKVEERTKGDPGRGIKWIRGIPVMLPQGRSWYFENNNRAVHYNKNAAQGAGLPFPYSAGVQNQSWLINLLTNWIGDEGWLKRNYAEYRKFVYFSDVIRFTGKVTKKYVDERGEHCIDILSYGFNQRGEDVIPSFSTVILPSKEKGTWPVRERLPVPEFRGTGK
ncbi:MAG: CoA transferase [Thermodesulfobacteriota bacterium]